VYWHIRNSNNGRQVWTGRTERLQWDLVRPSGSTLRSRGGPTQGATAALFGLFVSGLLLSFLGAILPLWGHEIRADYDTVGAYFLCLSVGVVTSGRLGQMIVRTKGVSAALIAGCAFGTAAFVYLAFTSPPAPPWARMPGIAAIGAAAGMLHPAIFHAISAMYRADPAATLNGGGTLFGLGCLTVALLISGAYGSYSVPATILLLAIAPAAFAVLCARTKFASAAAEAERPPRPLLEDLRTPIAVFFALLLFFQFGNEWAIAGWLPLFLVHRLGINPASALILAALYWLALIVGRLVAQSVLPRVTHGKLLLSAICAAAFGCLVLAFTNNRFGAAAGILFIGGGFAPIYPLVAESIGDRFPYYHPGLYNGIFSFAMSGGLLAPCALGYLADFAGIRVVVLLPFFGAVMVLALMMAIWLAARSTPHGKSKAAAPIGPS
jgi:fucose permease